MLTAGVDLAAEKKGTALAVIDWHSGGAILRELSLGVADEQIVSVTGEVDKLGIDCALGWPDEFVSFITAHANHRTDGPPIEGGMDWRRTLAYRETDREARRQTGRWPLSVSTDRLGLTAMRCAGLLARITESGIPVDRSGSGVVVEIYPGASLRLWGFITTGYRVDPERRRVLLHTIRGAAPWLDLGTFELQMISSGDAFDAVIAALSTRNAALGAYFPPSPQMVDRARREGWIALPNGQRLFGDLVL
jgi:predicted nuclease with RNAse H fold